MPGLAQVDDCQAPTGERRLAGRVKEGTSIVWPAVRHAVAHDVAPFTQVRPGPRIDDSGYSAHAWLLLADDIRGLLMATSGAVGRRCD
jgi:hypothetical protein